MIFFGLILFLTAFVFTFLITPYVIKIAKKYNLTDNPKIRIHPAHTHRGTIPRGGGLALLFGFLIASSLLFPFSGPLLGIIICVIILTIVGIWDDKKDRSPYLRFVINCFVAFIAIQSGIRIPYITNPFGGVIELSRQIFAFHFAFIDFHLFTGDIIALIWIVWTTNIVGWSGGVDGQMPGFVSIAALIIGILSTRFAKMDTEQIHVMLLSFITSGAFLGFLPWNYYPQKIMPGYGGKTLAGFLLAVLSIMSFAKLGTALLVLAIPMMDAGFIFLKRITSGKSPVFASSGHLHHQLLSLGWGKRRIALFYWSISAITGLIALSLNSKQKVFAIILVLVIIIGLILWINYLKENDKNKEVI